MYVLYFFMSSHKIDYPLNNYSAFPRGDIGEAGKCHVRDLSEYMLATIH